MANEIQTINAALEAGHDLPLPGVDARYAGNKAILWAKCDRLALGKDGASIKVVRYGKFSCWLMAHQVQRLAEIVGNRQAA